MEYEVVIEMGEALAITSGWTFIEAEPDAIYLVPCRAVKLAPGLHVLRPVGEAYPSGAVRAKVTRVESMGR